MKPGKGSAANGNGGKDNIVEGTDGPDYIDSGYTGDPEGDKVDSNDNPAGNNDDVILADEGSDVIYAGAGDDIVDAGSGHDYVRGGAGDDVLDGGSGSDQVYGDDGDDTINLGSGHDYADGGAGDDRLSGDEGDDHLYGGSGDDRLCAGDGRDDLNGGDGDDILSGGNESDRLHGNAGDDTLYGGTGKDALYGGDGDDILVGGEGIDHLDGGAGADILKAEGGDAINGGRGGDDDDTLQVEGSFEVVVGGAAGGSGTYALSPGDTLDFGDGANVWGTVFLPDGKFMHFQNIERIEAVDHHDDEPEGCICFAAGTRIATTRGEVPVEALEVGDRVITRDNGIQRIVWIGRQRFGTGRLAAQPALAPVRIRAGALGDNLPERDLVVSPQHRMLLASPRAHLLYGEPEVLAAASALVGRPGVDRLAPPGIEYVHIMFERHELVLANGAWSESFQPGDWSLGTIGAAQRAELYAIFPELATAASRAHGDPMPAARPSLRKWEVQALAL